MTENLLNILIAEDHRMTARLLRSALNKQGSMRVVDVLGNGRDVVEAAGNSELDVDVILLDIELPLMNGFEVIKSLDKSSQKKVLVLSAHTEKDFMQKSKALGARGYISKSSGMQEIIEGIKAVAGGRQFFEMEMLTAMAGIKKKEKMKINMKDFSHTFFYSLIF